MHETSNSFYASRAKRILDIAGSLILLVIAAPIHALCAVAVAAFSGRPIYYHQLRVGKDGAIFRIRKFRTMTPSPDSTFGVCPPEPTITSVGRVLRRLSLDEIPQLLNILQGEMSLIGPRPTLPSQVERYTFEQRGRHAVRPGLTGLAQIRYRDDAPWSQRITVDLEYVHNISLRTDLGILLRTFTAVIKAKGQVMDQTPDVYELGSTSPGDNPTL